MKIIAINASPRKTGATAKIIAEFENYLGRYGDIDITTIHLSDLKMDYCKGCCSCYQTGKCFLDDDAEMLSRAIAEADGLIIASPNYVSGIPGQLKTFIDRGHFVIEQLLKNVYTLSVVTYENADGKTVIKYLKNLFLLSGARTTGHILIKLPFNENPLNNVRLQKQISMQSHRFYNAIKNRASANIRHRIVHSIAFRFVLKPFVLKKGQKYQGVLQHWEKRGISFERL